MFVPVVHNNRHRRQQTLTDSDLIPLFVETNLGGIEEASVSGLHHQHSRERKKQHKKINVRVT